MGGDRRLELLNIDFVESYRAFCRHTGHRLPAAVSDSWLTWWGPMRLELRTLFDLLQQHGSLDAQTDLQTWQQVSRSISCSNNCSSSPFQQQLLPAETVKQLFCTHLAGFRSYQQMQQLGLDTSCRTSDQQLQQPTVKPIQPQQDKQRKQQQQQQPGRAKPRLKPTHRTQHLGTRAPRAAHHSSRSNATTAPLAVGRAATKRPAAAAPASGVRRTGRARVQAVRVGYVPSDTITDDIMAMSSSDSDTDVDAHTDSKAQQLEQQPSMLGPAHQAELPQLQQRPARPTAAEAKFLTTPVYTPTAGQQQEQQEQPKPALALPPGQFHAQWVATGSGAARLQLLQQWLQRSDAAMGHGVAERLGLGLLGWKLAAAWSPQEELLFALGMLERYRLFAHIQPRYLPHRSVHELNGYYYSVWKTRAGRLAEEYALLCETEGDPVKFRQSLCMRLAAMWDARSMGPIPAAAALPPALAVKVLAKASAAPKAAAAAAAAKSTTRIKRAAKQLGGKAVAVAPAAAATSSPVGQQHCWLRLTPAALSTSRAAGPGLHRNSTLRNVVYFGGSNSSSSSGSLPLDLQRVNASLLHHQGQQSMRQLACTPAGQCMAAGDKDGSSSWCHTQEMQQPAHKHMELDQQQFDSPCCSPSAAAAQACSSAGCGSDSSWACSSLLDPNGGKGSSSVADAAGGNRKRARVQQSNADKERAACASGRRLSRVDGAASDHDCEVLVVAG